MRYFFVVAMGMLASSVGMAQSVLEQMSDNELAKVRAEAAIDAPQGDSPAELLILDTIDGDDTDDDNGHANDAPN